MGAPGVSPRGRPRRVCDNRIMVLVLLLTGTFGAHVVGVLQVGGWGLVALLLAILPWHMLQPIQHRLDQRRQIRALVRSIKRMKKFGQDTTIQEGLLADLVAVTESRKRAHERKTLGYVDPDSN